ncbi:hypothetical protein RvY_06919 [Ramazzottius varieornatus]|uniref:Uncharacterized protein n=1 Tax=Ramazzottius varieornatus TaxID=947166 RepID=A0A1D1V8X0_RAMVA|nr:hypothetical protein RvY_06919 [Ramazzottius varieornatus]
MQVNTSNDVKIYNLSAGRSQPAWISERKRRQMERADVNLRRRIQLIQDFEMPEVSQGIKVSPDGQYVMASGAYKPRMRCYDTAEMSMKFERCTDSEIVRFLILSEDYSKMICLQNDRYVEFHAQYGKYYRIRIPRFGRDMVYQPELCHLNLVGASNEVYRLNLEEGKFMESLQSSFATEINSCDINPLHQLLMTGSSNGYVEAWDPRSGKSEGVISCDIPDLISNGSGLSVTKLKFRDALNLAVGTSTGHILLYDIRSPKPYYIKDHNYSLPIKAIEFILEGDLIASMDSKILKLWERETGKPVTSIEPGTDLNDLCIVPDSGLIFMANEAPKILSYFVPSLGPAPKWCAFLDSLTEELEETAESAIYDDYKFLTADELDKLGLSDLIGTNLLRAYMHGFFVDARLYKKAKSIVEPFNYEDYRSHKIKEKLQAEQSESRVKVDKLPKVNTALAKKFLEASTNMDGKAKKKARMVDGNPLEDARFGDLFKNPAFEIDPTTEEYRLINPLVSKIEKRRKAKESHAEEEDVEKGEKEEPTELPDLEENGRRGEQEGSSDSSDDDREWVAERRKVHRTIRDEEYMERQTRRARKLLMVDPNRRGKVTEVETGTVPLISGRGVNKANVKPLGARLDEEEKQRGGAEEVQLAGGNRQMTFSLQSKGYERGREASAKHAMERKSVHRSSRGIGTKIKKPWKGKK